MPITQYPGASHIFDVYRRNQFTMVGANAVVAPDALISTNESILIKDSSSTITLLNGTTKFEGRYQGSTFLSTAAQLGDILLDQTENDVKGNPVAYEVQGVQNGSLRAKFHLVRTEYTI